MGYWTGENELPFLLNECKVRVQSFAVQQESDRLIGRTSLTSISSLSFLFLSMRTMKTTCRGYVIRLYPELLVP